jgi:hypothetical protein
MFQSGYETGVLHDVGLRDTLEPDPDNTGVGSFQSLLAPFLESHSERSCFMDLETREKYAQSRRCRSRSYFAANNRAPKDIFAAKTAKRTPVQRMVCRCGAAVRFGDR